MLVLQRLHSSVLQVLYEFVVVVVVVVANIHHMTFITLIIFIKFW